MYKVALIRLPSSAMLYLASVVMILSLLDLDLAAAADELDTQEDTMATGMTDDDESAMEKRSPVTVCPTDTEESRKDLYLCLEKGERFLTRYFKRYYKKQFEKCSDYSEFKKCINPILHNCPNAKSTLPSEWVSAIQLMNCACQDTTTQTTTECLGSLQCMEGEMDSVFMQRCDTSFELNVQQKTQDHCHFLTEYIQCRERVVSSGCGQDSGNLLYLAHKVAAWNNYKCDVRKWPEYNGFEYGPTCPRNITDIMDSCMEQSLSAKVLKFDIDNNLIPVENKEAIDLACRAYQNYKTCLNPYKTSCPKGVTTAMDQENELRTYLIKMEYICDTTQQRFSEHVDCYQRVQTEALLGSCYKHWKKINNWLKNITEFDYYCKPNGKQSAGLKRAMSKLQTCYMQIYTEECNTDTEDNTDPLSDAAALMGGIITKAFSDPLYLRFQYKPDCALHTMVSLSDRVPTHHRHRHHDKGRHRFKLKHMQNSSPPLSKKDIRETAYSDYSRGTGSRVGVFGGGIVNSIVLGVIVWWAYVNYIL